MNEIIGKIFHTAVLLTFLSAGILSAQTAYIEIVPMSPTLKSQLQLGEEFYYSTGLQNVGKGEHVYLRAVDRQGNDITNYSWELISKPDGSTAEIVSVTDGLYYFEADAVGKYTVGLSITTSAGTANTTREFSGNTYIGVGGVGGIGIEFGTCGQCHTHLTPDIMDAWRESRHATLFQRGIDGEYPGNFAASRQRTSTTGPVDRDLGSGSFFSLKAETGWEFPASPAPGNFQQLVDDHPQLAQVATIGCESCHGAASLHGDFDFSEGTMSVSFTSESCQSCHDAPYLPTFHQFRRSGHSAPVWSGSFQNRAASNDLQFCARCHDGKSYAYFVKGKEFDTNAEVFNPTTHVGVTCETCHDPHAGGMRKAPASSDTLAGGFNYADIQLGAGATCTDCHKFRGDGYASVMNSNVTIRWGPHYAGATDVLLGKGGYEFDTPMPTSMAHRSQENSCASCHMAGSTAQGLELGGHSFSMSNGENDLIEACVSCHPGSSSFADIPGADYNMTGRVQPFMEEVQGLLDMLAEALPPLGEPTINWAAIDNENIDQKGAYWNYLYVRNDKSLGIHNPKYVVTLLQRSIHRLTGVEFEHTPDVPRDFTLYQNYPNPFNPTTQIQFSIPEPTDVSLEIYDITGRLVTTLINESLATGTYNVTWDARNRSGQIVSSGIYLYRIQAGSFVQTNRMVFIK
jgi:hypothetical protein